MKKFKDNIHFTLYGVEYQVAAMIEGERVAVIVAAKTFYKPLVFFCIEDYKQTLNQILQGLWKKETNCRPCEEYKSVLNLLTNQFGYYSAILYDNYRQLGYPTETYIKENRISYKAIKHLI